MTITNTTPAPTIGTAVAAYPPDAAPARNTFAPETALSPTEIMAEQLRQAYERIGVLNLTVSELQARLGDTSSGIAPESFLQMKAHRQTVALDRLNRRVLAQRLQLRLHTEAGHTITRDAYLAARAAHPEATRIPTDPTT